MKVMIAIQCRDSRTRQIGSFGYSERRPMYSVTPVFEDLIGLYAYLKEHNIDY